MTSQIRKLQKRAQNDRQYVDAVLFHVERGRFLRWAETWVSQLWRATHWTGAAACAWVVFWFLACCLISATR